MRRMIPGLALALGLSLGASNAFGRPSGARGEGPVAVRKEAGAARTLEGKVTEYRPNRALTIVTVDDATHTIYLDDRALLASLDSGLAVGAHVRAVEGHDAKGHRTLIVTVVRSTRAAR